MLIELAGSLTDTAFFQQDLKIPEYWFSPGLVCLLMLLM